MAVAAHATIQAHVNSIHIQWMVNERNHQLVHALDLAGLKYTTLQNKRQYSLWRNPLYALMMICRNAVALRRLSPDLIMVIQGGIFLSFGGVLSALIGRMRFCSYIPMVTSISDTRKYRFPTLMDFLWSLLYRVISSYITIDTEQADKLRRKNHNASVFVVENYVPKAEALNPQRDTKVAIGVPPGRKMLSVIGRIEFSQKCQDWIFRVLRDDPFMIDKFVVFVGDGSDAQRLQAMLVPEVLDRFRLVGWKNDLRDIYSATDVLLIPSRSEGVPLVMLEALSYRIPVVGTDRDGMRSWLPREWRYKWGDREGLKHGIEQVLSSTSTDMWEEITQRLERVHDAHRFAAEFSHALTHYCTS